MQLVSFTHVSLQNEAASSSRRSLQHGASNGETFAHPSTTLEISQKSHFSAMEKETQKRVRNRERAAQRRAMETESERSHRLEASRRYSAEKRARESEEKKAERRMMDRKRAAERRAKESQLEREQRLALGRQRAAERRAAESEEEREHRLAQNRERLASKRAAKPKAEKLSLPAAVEPAPAGPWCRNGAGGGHNVQPAVLFNGVEHTFQEAELTSDPLPVDSVAVEKSKVRVPVDMARVVQPQQQAVPVATAEQTASTGAVGGEKTGELKQEVLEIKEFRAVEPNLERHYNELLKVISEIGRDVKPAYTNNKVSTDRLRKNIMMARGIVRECVQDVDRLATEVATASSSSSSST